MPKYKVCAVFGCTPAPNSPRKMHSFPKILKLRERWAHLCCRSDTINHGTAKICEKHFSPQQKRRCLKHELLGYTPQNYRDLLHDAVPDMNLPFQQTSSLSDFFPRGYAMESCERVNSIECKTKDELQPSTSSSSTVWSEMPEPKINAAAEVASIKEEVTTITFFKESCWSSETCMDEFSKSTYAVCEFTSSAALGAEGDSFDPIEMVEVKQEDLEDQIDIKPELLPCEEDLLPPDAALVTGCGSEEEQSWTAPASAEKLATCPPVLSGEGSSAIEETTTKADLVVDAVRVTDKMCDEGSTSVFLFNCVLCHYGSNHRKALKKHLIIHENNRPMHFVYTQCKYKTSDEKSLKSHILTHNKNRIKNICCSHCHYKTNRPYCLHRHLLTHLPNKDKPFSCAHCPFRTAIKNALAQHLKIHDPNRVKKFSCTHCVYSTDDEDTYRCHLRTHNSNRPKPFACPKCNFRTDLKSSLHTHLLRHENRSLACLQCPFKTIYKNSYKKHLMRHDTKAKLMICPKCPYSTHSKVRYHRHLTSHENALSRYEKARSQLNWKFKVEPLS